MKNRSLRFRLTVWYSLALTAGLGLFALTIWFSMKRSLFQEIDDTLSGQAQSLDLFLKRELAEQNVHLSEELEEYAGALPSSTFVQLRDSGGKILLTSNPAFSFPPHQNTNGKPQRWRWKNHDYRVIFQQVIENGETYEIQVADALDAAEFLLRWLNWLLIGCMPPVIVAATLGGNWLSRRALKPVDNITQAARSLGISNLSDRLAVPTTGDELQSLAETWNGMLDRLERAVTQLSRFAADASHEIRTPLAVIRTTAELAARRDRSPESYQKALASIIAESERMTRLVDDLLLLARCDSQAADMPLRKMDLCAVVEETCRLTRSLAEKKRVHIHFLRSEGDFLISGNNMAVLQLLTVLFDNAVKYSSIASDIHVSLTEQEEIVLFEITDHGIGIPPDDLPHIFERFYRAKYDESKTSEGYGIGLSLAESIARIHHVKIEVISTPNVGSTFRLAFPRVHCLTPAQGTVVV